MVLFCWLDSAVFGDVLSYRMHQSASPILTQSPRGTGHTEEGREGDCFFTDSWRRILGAGSGAAGVECWYQWSSNMAAVAMGKCASPGGVSGRAQLVSAGIAGELFGGGRGWSGGDRKSVV